MRKRTLLSKVRKVVAVSLIGVTLSSFTVGLSGNLLVANAEIIKSSNIQLQTNNNGYSGYWSSPIYSYLVECDDGNLMRVQWNWNNSKTVVEYYDKDLNVTSYKEIDAELPIFGGFYAGSDAYYIVTGQNNKEESANVECFRITKYDKSWNRIASTGLSDCNTTKPFNAGSLRMTEDNGYLFIRTSHEMYAIDGVNHQANVTIQVDEKNMKITDHYTDIMNVNYGYVSHSFNQFIKTENNHIVAVDHGDAGPRSIVLIEYPTDFTNGQFISNLNWNQNCKSTNLLSFAGNIGNNYTGASVGGFEISDSAYLVAANSIDQENKGTVRNVYVLGKSKTDDTLINYKLTDYADDSQSASTPYLVKVEDNKYMVLWDISNSNDNKVYYTYIDGSGKQIGEIKSINGYLSQCEPIVHNGTVLWYSSTDKDKNITFYGINKDGSELKQSITVTQNVVQNNGDVKITATGNGGSGKLTYKFSMYNEDTKQWTVLQDYSERNEYTGKLTQTGNLSFYTEVKDVNGDVVKSEATTIKVDKNNNNQETTAPEATTKATEATTKVPEATTEVTTKAPETEVTTKVTEATTKATESTTKATEATTKATKPEEKLNGIVDGGYGNWYYYVDGKVDRNYNGLAQNENGWWKITRGVVDFGCNDVVEFNGSWWKITNGQVDFGYNGLAENEYGWWKIAEGKVDFESNDVVEFNGNWWKITNGQVDFGYNSLAENEYGWWKIAEGKVDFESNDVVEFNGNWWKTTNGQVDFGYNDLAENEYGWWKIAGGQVDFDCNTLVEFNNGWWKVEAGRVNFESNTVCEFNGAWWKITNGFVDFGYNSLAENEYGWWKIADGRVDFESNDVVEFNGAWWKTTNGQVDFGYNSLAQNEYGWWKITNGMVDFNYNGYETYEGVEYHVTNGRVD